MGEQRIGRRPVAAGLIFAAWGGITNRAMAQHAPASPGTESATPASASGTGVRSISVEGQPVAISPDGKWLAGPGPDRDFCIWDVETLTPMCTSEPKPLDIQLETITWAPDSSAVAFTLDAARLFRDSDLYVMDIDGTLHDLTDDGPEDKLSLSSDAPDIPVDMCPAWSPEGDQLAFARTQWGSEAKSTSIMTVPLEGGDPNNRLLVSPMEPMVIYSPMHWLENGDIIFSVLHADPSNAQTGIWRVTASGGVERIITGDTKADIPLPWVNDVSPDGTLATVFSSLLAYQMPAGDLPVYFIVDLATGESISIEPADPEPGETIASAGTFLPDGSGILSIQAAGNRAKLIRSALDGSVIESTQLPDAAVGPATLRGLSVADDGTVFMPTLATEDRNKRGGILFTIDP